MSCKSASFYIKTDNLEYIEDQIKDKPRYNKSNWLDDLIDHLRNKNKPKVNTEVKVKTKRFKPPSIEEVESYMTDKFGSGLEAEKFYDFYTSKNWMVGKNKMKDWKASVRNWMRGNKASGASAGRNRIKQREDRSAAIKATGLDTDVWDEQ